MAEGTVLVEGKTKIIRSDPECHEHTVVVESKDDITGGDGLKHDVMSSKAAASTTTTCNNFELLRHHGVETHFFDRIDERRFRAERMEMIPLELVARRYAYGSYLKRHSEFKRPEGEPPVRFDQLVVEFFYKDDDLSPPEDKDDTMNDPLAIMDVVTGRIIRFKPKRPMAEGFIDVLPEFPSGLSAAEVLLLADLTRDSFLVLEEAWWEAHNIAIADFKIECGRRTEDGKVMIADVIDNDSWRIWPDGDPTRALDKENYRQGSKSLDEIEDDYQLVAHLSESIVPA